MSYYTTFNLQWEGDTPTIDEVARVLALVKAGQPDDHVQGLAADLGKFKNEEAWWDGVLQGEYETSWYEHELDMARVSRLWPNIRFDLHGRGEGYMDFWYEYYLDGKAQQAPGDLVYPEFDASCLEEVQTPPEGVFPSAREGFIHRGVFAWPDGQRGYWLMPLSPDVRLGIKRKEENPCVQVTSHDRDAVLGEIDWMLEEGEGFEGFEVTRSNAVEEARAQVSDAIKERIASLRLGVLYPEMEDRPEAVAVVSEAMSAMLQAFQQGEALPEGVDVVSEATNAKLKAWQRGETQPGVDLQDSR